MSMKMRALRWMMATAGALCLMMAPAQAEVEIVGHAYTPADLGGGISLQQPTPTSFYGVAGRFLVTTRDTNTGALDEFFTFCVDVLTGINTYVAYNDVAGDGLFADLTRRQHLAALLTFGNPLIDGAASVTEAQEIASALQIAVWEVVYDSPGSYDVSSGVFSVYGAFEPLVARSNSYLANLANGSWLGDERRLRGLRAVQPGSTQNQIYLTAEAAIPEPATWAMMILGFGVVGGALRRRRQAIRTARTA
jgi:hypothetical protein